MPKKQIPEQAIKKNKIHLMNRRDQKEISLSLILRATDQVLMV